MIVSKLRSRESFSLSWREAAENGDGRTTIWLDPAQLIYFRFDGSRAPAIDKAWVERLAISAASSTGLVVVDENGEYVRAISSTRGPR